MAISGKMPLLTRISVQFALLLWTVLHMRVLHSKPSSDRGYVFDWRWRRREKVNSICVSLKDIHFLIHTRKGCFNDSNVDSNVPGKVQSSWTSETNLKIDQNNSADSRVETDVFVGHYKISISEPRDTGLQITQLKGSANRRLGEL